MNRGDPELTFTLRLKHNRDALPGGFESDESSTPAKTRRMHVFNGFGDWNYYFI